MEARRPRDGSIKCSPVGYPGALRSLRNSFYLVAEDVQQACVGVTTGFEKDVRGHTAALDHTSRRLQRDEASPLLQLSRPYHRAHVRPHQ